MPHAALLMLIMFCPIDGGRSIDVQASNLAGPCTSARFDDLAADLHEQVPALSTMRADAFSCFPPPPASLSH